MSRADDLVRDLATRERAQCSFDEAQVVEAGAGTGKTAVLVARILAWCLGTGWDRTRERLTNDGDPPAPPAIAREVLSRVVAITFTEAAAAEMASRVSSGLLDIRRGERPVGFLEASIPAEAPERAQALLDASDQIVIQTIHAFCRRLLASYPLEAHLHPAFEVDADESGLSAVSRSVVETHLQAAYGSDGDPDTFALGVAGFGPPALEEALGSLLRTGATPEDLGDPLSPARVGAWRTGFLEVLARFEEAEDGGIHCGGGEQAATVERLGQLKQRLAGMSVDADGAVALFGDALELCTDRDRADRLKDWSKARFKKSADVAGREDEIASAVEALLPFVDSLRKTDIALLMHGHRVMTPLLETARAELRRRGIQPFPALLRDTETLLTRSPDVAAQVRARIDQILVDEFQDTDAGQCEILRQLQSPGGPVVFVVGDPKQSIYGWRNADLAAYRDFTEELVPDADERGTLCVNHRSVQPVLDEVERCIAPLFGNGSDWQAPFQALQASEGRRLDPGFTEGDAAPVEHWVSWEWEDGAPVPTLSDAATRLEAEAVAADIAAHLERPGVRPGDFGILLRSLGQVEVVLAALRDAGVPYMVERDKGYYQRREIIDAAAVVRWLLDPHDQLALVAVLKSALVGVPDAALVPLWESDFPSLAGAILDAGDAATEATLAVLQAVTLPDGTPGLARIEGWRANAAAFFREVGGLRETAARQPADVFVERLRRRLLIESAESARMLGRFRLANLDRFFRELAVSLEDGEQATVVAGLRRAVASEQEEEEGRPRGIDDRAVHVLTVHKAKGLAFEHVYLMQLHRGHAARSLKQTRLEARGSRSAVSLLGADSLEVPLLALDRDAIEAAEQERVLYVAMTRARKRLVLVGNPSATRGNPPIKLLERREGRPSDLGALAAELVPSSEQTAVVDWVDAGGARWRFPGHSVPLRQSAPPSEGIGDAVVDRSRVEADAARILERSRFAEARMMRPLAGRASDVHAAWVDLAQADAAEANRALPGPHVAQTGSDAAASRAHAMLVGTAVHAALEVHESGLDAAVAPLAAIDAVASAAGTEHGPQVRAEARRTWERFLEGPLHERFREVESQIVSRELPVALAAAPDSIDGPIAYRTGAIDLVYRDPDGSWVVVDYKTDAVDPGPELDARAAGYAPQGNAYAQALMEALALAAPPRVEFWFLHSGQVVVADAV